MTKKKSNKEDIEYVEFTKICGDCGRKFKEKFVLNKREERITKQEARKLMDFYYSMFNVACKRCSKKHEDD